MFIGMFKLVVQPTLDIILLQVYDKDADANKEATFKLARDTKNPTAFEKERHLGTYRTTQSMAFAPPPEVC